MIILKPSWISHNGMPIFSIDIHPDGTRLATGGQGRDSGLVMLWNTAAVLDENKENDENVPKILCQVCLFEQIYTFELHWFFLNEIFYYT